MMRAVVLATGVLLACGVADAQAAQGQQTKTLAEKLEDLLSGVRNSPEVRTPGTQGANPVQDVPNTVMFAQAIGSQLISNRCWTDHSDMADAHRLRAVINIRLGRNGRFLDEPKLVEPARPPANDPAMQAYIQETFMALNKCNAIGFKIPPEYFELPPASQEILLVFLPKVTAPRVS
jgi:hypothetical protein